ncbi:MAG: hypothetical protein JOZ81_33710 [Chloroflexi bacterium]|nr:hypothetical protein [Chloroflexota bacterium]MBV9545510.1 hypothetical protein [Chloroflexota bacterium]
MQNTTGGFDNNPLVQVREGMHVLDAAGDEVGRVQLVQMGDPESTTVSDTDKPRDIIGVVGESIFPNEREPDVPEPLRSRLRRTGYIKIDGPDLMDTDRYVASNRVTEVSGDRVRLSVRKDQLAREE